MPVKKIFWQRDDKSLNPNRKWAYDATFVMGVIKLKPVRIPRLLDEWTEEKERAHEATVRGSEVAIQNSKKLVAQSKEILDRIRHGSRRNAKQKAG
ncbi:MAG TPA: hypothetical protein VHV32_10915 [Candidatus Angelobacter sp.]|jgi:hypothetical protein|nr:hypothetical protein [Candidatus Angelobacter sp.]